MDHLQLQEETRKLQQEYIDKAQSKADQEFKHRLEGNIKCLAMCDTLKKVKEIQSQVERDNDEFGYQVLHKGLYDNSPMKPQTELPFEGNL